MRTLHSGGGTIAVVCGAALCVAAAAAGRPAAAQRGGARPSSVERRVEQLNRQGEQYERDKLRRDLEGGEAADDPRERKRSQAVAAQVREDFEHLQAAYNRIVLAMASKEGFQEQSIMPDLAEIKKCSTRLKGNLALPRPKGEGHKEPREAAAQPARLEESLMVLRRHIYSFVTNPLFEAPGVLDVEQATKAGRDLDRIIELSEELRKGADRAKKSEH